MTAKKFFSPLRNPSLIGVILLLSIGLPWILTVSDPTPIRQFIGLGDTAQIQIAQTNELVTTPGSEVEGTNGVQSTSLVSPTIAARTGTRPTGR